MNDLYVTKRKFHWKDLKHVINFVDNLTEIAQRMNAGFWMRLIRPTSRRPVHSHGHNYNHDNVNVQKSM